MFVYLHPEVTQVTGQISEVRTVREAEEQVSHFSIVNYKVTKIESLLL